MSTLQMLDVAIGIIFIYLLLSFICTAVNEIVESIIKKRASDLQRGIRELLQPTSNEPDGLLAKFYKHPLIYGLYLKPYSHKSSKNLPSYIPSRNFALALMDLILPAKETNLSGAVGGGSTPNPESEDKNTDLPARLIPLINTIQTLPDSAEKNALLKLIVDKEKKGSKPAASLQPLRNAILSWSESNAKQALLTLIDAAGDDIDVARQNVESWYDTTMDRVSGWYKRRVQQILIAIGFVIAVAMNADSIAIYLSLANDTPLRNSMVAAAQEYAKSSNFQKDLNKTPEERVENNIKRLNELRLPIGWDWHQADSLQMATDPLQDPKHLTHDALAIPAKNDGFGWMRKVVGWIITGLAVSLGAPFWFDLLNKVMVIRSTVKPHEKSQEEGSEDRQN